MRLRNKFIIFAILIHAILIVLSLLLLEQSRYLFMAAEVLILLSLAITIHLYRAFLKPLNLLSAGVESIKDQDFSTTFVMTGQHDLDRLIEVYNRMIEQLRDERVRQQQQHFFLERLISATPIGIIILDLDGRVAMLNPAAQTLLGSKSEDAVGRPLDAFPGIPGQELHGMAAGETRTISMSGIHTYKCSKSHFLDRGFYRQFIVIEELTQEILASQKRAYEKVIRMMSHEINNSVGAVNSILESSLHYRTQLNTDDRIDFEDAIRVAIERNRGLNKFMANFADVVRIPPPVKSSYDIHKLLQSVHVLLSADCKKRDIKWLWELSSTPLTAEIDVQQMEQVLVNIVKNAIEAIGNNGQVIIRTTGQPMILSVTDTGKGISPEQRAHLFTPFYSTKKDGQGVGLTLIREILLNHGFSFNLETTEPGRTVFTIDFNHPGPFQSV